MRALLIVAAVVCVLLAADYYRFDGFYTDKFVEMGQHLLQGLSK